MKRVVYKVFQSATESWESLFDQAAEFASSLGPEQLISISHSENIRSMGAVSVWYWQGDGDAPGQLRT